MTQAENTEELLYLYICDGTKCRGNSDCYLAGGPCSHTSDIGHSIKRNNPAIPTRWERYVNCIIEQVVLDGDSEWVVVEVDSELEG